MAENEHPNAAEQQVGFKRSGDVRKEMIRAGSQGKSRIYAGIAAALENRMSSKYGDGATTQVSRLLRLFGKDRSAEWIDRFFAIEKPKPDKKGKKGDVSTTTTTPTKESSGLASVKKQLNFITGIVSMTAEDVTDIKSLLMPKGIAAKNKEGDTQFVQFNPLAPPGEQFNQVTQSGKLSALKPRKDFQQSAQKKAAMATAELALKIMEKDKAKAELRKKFSWKDKEEKIKKEDPTAIAVEELRLDMDKRFDHVGEALEDLQAGGIFKTLLKAIPLMLPIFEALLDLGIMGLVGLITAAVADAVWQKLVDWWNNNNIDQKLLNVTKAISDNLRGWLERAHLIKSDADYAAEASKNAKEGRMPGGVASTKGLSIQENIDKLDAIAKDESKPADVRAANAKARDTLIGVRDKYVQDSVAKAGGKIPTPKQETIPAAVMAEGSDTVDTNYASVPVAPAVRQAPAETVARRPTPQVAAVGETGALTTAQSKEIPYDMIKSKMGLSKEEWDVYRSTVASIESAGAGGYAAVGGAGDHYDGKYQMGEVAKKDAFRILGLPYPGHGKKDSAARVAFRNDPMLQERAFAAYTIANHGYLSNKSSKYKDLEKRKQLEVLGYSHNQGWSGGKNWLEKGVVGSDAFGTKGTKYSNALASSFQNLEPVKSAANITPMPTVVGGQMDSQSRKKEAATSGSATLAMVAPTVVNNTQVTQTVGKRPAAKASVLAQDKALVRTVTKDAQHPVYG